MHKHYLAVIELLDLDPLSAEASRLRAEIAGLEWRDPTLIAQRIDLMAAHVTPIGEVPSAEREQRMPEGILLT